MRDQGRLVEWFDEKGYGFIQPNGLKKVRVFLHIRDFEKRGPRPIVGCALDYQVILDEKGRYRAQQARYLKASQISHISEPKEKKGSHTAWQPMQIICIAYLFFLVILTFMGMLNNLFLLFISIINIVTYWLYAQDKEAALLKQRRIPENLLHILAFLGGWPAAWVAQQKLRHKTQKQPFKNIYFCTIILNILLIIWCISPLSII